MHMGFGRVLGVVMLGSFAPVFLLSFDERPAVAGQFGADRDPIDLNEISKQIASAVRETTALHGAWLFVTADDRNDPGVAPRRYIFRRVLDRSREKMQRDLLDRFIAARIPAGQIEFLADQIFPFSTLISECTAAVDLQLMGCQIMDAYYDENQADGSLNLVLVGRVHDENQVERLERICNKLMSNSAAWNNSGVSLSTKDGVQVASSSATNGVYFYEEGLKHFWKGQYQLAAEAFQQACIERPRVLEYQYWRVVLDIAKGRRDHAEIRLRNIVAEYRVEPLSADYRAVNQSLIRLQGPLRTELRRLEAHAMLIAARDRQGIRD